MGHLKILGPQGTLFTLNDTERMWYVLLSMLGVKAPFLSPQIYNKIIHDINWQLVTAWAMFRSSNNIECHALYYVYESLDIVINLACKSHISKIFRALVRTNILYISRHYTLKCLCNIKLWHYYDSCSRNTATFPQLDLFVIRWEGKLQPKIQQVSTKLGSSTSGWCNLWNRRRPLSIAGPDPCSSSHLTNAFGYRKIKIYCIYNQVTDVEAVVNISKYQYVFTTVCLMSSLLSTNLFLVEVVYAYVQLTRPSHLKAED